MGVRKNNGGSLKERVLVLIVGWLCLLSYAYGLGQMIGFGHYATEPDEVQIVMHSIEPMLSLLIWVAMGLFGIYVCFMLIIGTYEYAAGFSWAVFVAVPILAGLSALAPANQPWSAVDSMTASLFYLVEMLVAVVLLVTAQLARCSQRMYH